MRIDFYHLQKWPLERALPQLLTKVLTARKRALVIAGSCERVDSLNSTLWNYDPNSWLPHGSVKDGFAADQLIWLTDIDENPNNAEILVLTDGSVSNRLADYERCLDIFDGNSKHALESARERWKSADRDGHERHYWMQDESGGWEKQLLD